MNLIPVFLISVVFSVNAFSAALSTSSPVEADKHTNEATVKLFKQHCASCHGDDRLGLIGPPLIPQSFKRLKPDAAALVIKNGRAATQMPAFKDSLNDGDIAQLVDYIYEKPEQPPQWDMAAIKKSHKISNPIEHLGDKPVFEADLQNLFLIVELADHHVTLLDGDSFKPIFRLKTHNALHGGPKYSKDGRYVYFTSRDGWITKFDIYTLKVIADIRVGINTRNLAVSDDGRYIIAGNTLPHTAVVLNAHDLSPVKIIPVVNESGKSSRVSAVYTAAPRKSFILALKDFPEVWEIPYIDKKIFVHDYRYEMPEYAGTPFSIRRLKLDNYLDDFFFDQQYQHIIGAARPQGERLPQGGQVIKIASGRKVADVNLPGMPHLSSGISWKYKDTRIIATPNIKEGVVSIIDTENWKIIKKIKTKGPGFFMRSHENSPYAWVDVFFGPHKDLVHIIDKQSLDIVKTLQPVPGKTAAHVEFTKDGRYALLSIWEDDGAVIVYDAKTLKEVTRLPMKKPSGKYNVYNKTHLEEGTSH
jgi:mono/diheme cytochrome c family protein